MIDCHDKMLDEVEGRRGRWMHTSLGGRFFPMDPQAKEVRISDVANGLALDCRYAGQGGVDRYYSVAEHCFHMTCYAERLGRPWPARALLAVLLHDAAEAYLNDLPTAVKHAVGEGYVALERKVQAVVCQRFGIAREAEEWAESINDLDRRIVGNEKAAIMRYPQSWAADEVEPLEGITIHCWSPPAAKKAFLQMYRSICVAGSLPIEGYEL